jgi:hypothetical protein
MPSGGCKRPRPWRGLGYLELSWWGEWTVTAVAGALPANCCTEPLCVLCSELCWHLR